MKSSVRFFALMLLPASLYAAAPTPAVVVVPVADVWSEPSDNPAVLTDDKRETQVLSGEKVLIHESSGSWVRIEAVEQPEFTHHNRWEGYPGWVQRKALKEGTAPAPPAPGKPLTAKGVLTEAEHFLGSPYLWGGMTTQGVDCSGLVHLSYRAAGKKIPRDSHEQWMRAKRISSKDLKPGDLIFAAKTDQPKKVVHVALYLGDGRLIEAPQSGITVRKISFKDKFGADLASVDNGSPVSGERLVYFGRYLP